MEEYNSFQKEPIKTPDQIYHIHVELKEYLTNNTVDTIFHASGISKHCSFMELTMDIINEHISSKTLEYINKYKGIAEIYALSSITALLGFSNSTPTNGYIVSFII